MQKKRVATKKATKAKKASAKTARAAKSPFARRDPVAAATAKAELTHVYGNHVVCSTDARGHAMPRGLSPVKIVLDASEGFIPLWDEDVTLRWRFQESSLTAFEHPEEAKAVTRELLGRALLAWGDATPIKFLERRENWDFEIVFRESDDCDSSGCVLASAFFPGGGQGEVVLYPKLFEQTDQEQLETLVHELGHVFGLRHFFANVSERAWPSEVFGVHRPFSIMNYGAKSVLTDDDRNDLKRLYKQVWSRELTEINGTVIRLMRPFSARRTKIAI